MISKLFKNRLLTNALRALVSITLNTNLSYHVILDDCLQKCATTASLVGIDVVDLFIIIIILIKT